MRIKPFNHPVRSGPLTWPLRPSTCLGLAVLTVLNSRTYRSFLSIQNSSIPFSIRIRLDQGRPQGRACNSTRNHIQALGV